MKPISAAPKSEAQWQAESDANTLADANVIKTDKPRLTKAKVAAKRILREKQQQERALKAVAKVGPPKSRPKARARRKR